MSQDRYSRNHSLSHICGNSAVRGHRRDQIPRIDNEKLIIVILGRLLNSLRTFNLSEMICLPSRYSIIQLIEISKREGTLPSFNSMRRQKSQCSDDRP